MTTIVTENRTPRTQAPEQTIRRIIPGSNITVEFKISKGAQSIITVQAKVIEAQVLRKDYHTVPIQSFSDRSSCSFKNVRKILSEKAINYVCGNVIFLSGDVDKLIERWMERKTANNPEEKKNQRRYVKQLKNNGKCLKLAKNSRKAIDVYYTFGNEYFYTSKYESALLFFQHMFLIAKKISDSDGIRLAHQGFGNAYHALGETDRAIRHCKTGIALVNEKLKPVRTENELVQNKDLLRIEIEKKLRFEIAKIHLLLSNIYESINKHDEALSFLELFKNCVETEKLDTELSLAYGSEGNRYLSLNKYTLAEKAFEKSLEIDSENFTALSGLGTVYKTQGYYKKAIVKLKTVLEKNRVPSDTGVIHSLLGLTYLKLGESSLALYHFEEDFAIAMKTRNCESQARAHYNLAGYWIGHEDLEKGFEYIVDVLPFITQLDDHQLAGMIYGLLGHCYFESNQRDQSIKAYKEHLVLACAKKDLDGQITARNNLGRTYSCMDKFPEATNEYETALILASGAGDREAQSCLYHNLGRNYHYMKNLNEAIKYYWLSININSNLIKENCKDNPQWQISLFETQFKPYRCLEEAVLQTDTTEALKIADSSRSKALLMLLKENLELPEEQDLSFDKILEVASELKTTLVVYSCDPFNGKKAWCWVISPEKKLSLKNLILQNL